MAIQIEIDNFTAASEATHERPNLNLLPSWLGFVPKIILSAGLRPEELNAYQGVVATTLGKMAGQPYPVRVIAAAEECATAYMDKVPLTKSA